MKYSYFLCLFMILMVIVPVSAAPVINPVVQSEPFLCSLPIINWFANGCEKPVVSGILGPQGIPGINGTGGGDINYFNFSGSNLTTISNVTNFFNYTSIFSEMNQTANMTPGYTPIFGVDYFNGTDGAEGPPGPMNQTPNMTTGYTPVFGVDYFNGTDGTNGTNGTSTTIAINYTFTGLPGTEANITNVGNSTDALWDITIPQGIQGITGDTGATGGTGGQVLFFHHDPVESPAGYEGLFPTPAGTTEADETVVVQTGTGQVLVDPYITVAGYPGLTTLPAGLWRFRTFHYVNSAPGNTNAVFKVYNRSGATETLLFTATSGDINALVPTEYLTSYVQTLPYTVALTDRIVIKVYGQSDHSSNINFHFVYEGTNHTSHVQTPLETSSSLYIRHDGSVNFTGKQSMGGYNLTNVLDPVAAQDAATKNYVDTVNATGITDHGALSGLTDDDHVRYFDKDGGKALTGLSIRRNVDNEHIELWGGASAYSARMNSYGHDHVDPVAAGGHLFLVSTNSETDLVVLLSLLYGNGVPHVSLNGYQITNVKDPVSAQDAATKNYVDTKQKCGATATVADGGIITHTFGATPTYVLTTGTVANNVIDVTAKGSTNFTVSVKLGNTGAAGTTQTIYWCAG